MKKLSILIIFAVACILSAANTSAAVGIMKWTANGELTLTITNGEPAQFQYNVEAVTDEGGMFSIFLYKGSTPIKTYIYNQPTVDDGAVGKITVVPSDYQNTPGTYYVVLRSTDYYSDDEFNITLNVNPSQPQPISASCSATPTSGTEPLDVSFSASATGGSGTYTYSWDFGDGKGQAGTISSPTHQYNATTDPTIYNPTLTVRDNAGNTDMVNCPQLTVSKRVQPPSLSVALHAQPTSGYAPLHVDFSADATGGRPPYTYHWNFGDGNQNTMATLANSVNHTYTQSNVYTATVTVYDADGNYASDSVTINVLQPYLVIDELRCFDKIVVGHNQSCQVHVKDQDGNAAGNADVEIFFLDGTSFGTCRTDRISGGCTIYRQMESIGHYTVYADAYLEGYTPDTDRNPQFSFDVIDQEYDIINLNTYNDSAFTQQDSVFYRGEPLYVKFQVYDPINRIFITQDIVTAASLVSLPGGRADMTRLDFHDDWYYYRLDHIPTTHDFLGDSNVFAFAFNLEGTKGAQEQVSLTILNNKPTAFFIPNSVMNVGDRKRIDITPYGLDVEDTQSLLNWEIVSAGPNVEATVNREDRETILSIKALSAGASPITLRVYDLDGDYAQTTTYAIISQPVEQIAVSCTATPTSGQSPLTVAFSATATGGTGGYIYHWAFGDFGTNETTSSYALWTYSVSQPTMFMPAVIVTDNSGNSASAQCPVISVSPHVEPLSASCLATPTMGRAPLDVTFRGEVSGGSGPYTYQWEFGTGEATNSGSLDFQHYIYRVADIYYPHLIVTDSASNNIRVACPIINVTEQPAEQITATCSASPTSGTAPLTVSFTSTASGGSGTLNYDWDFGDGATEQDGSSASHTYGASTTGYNPALTVSDNFGHQTTVSCPHITAAPQPAGLNASCSAAPTQGTSPLDVHFTASASGGSGAYDYQWEFGNGATMDSGAAAGVDYRYSNASVYYPYLRVVDSNSNNVRVACPMITVTAPAPANLSLTCTANPTSGFAPLTVGFNAQASGGSGTYSYMWNFDDSTISPGNSTISHIYTAARTYFPFVTVTDGNNNIISASCSAAGITVNATRPPSNITADAGGPYLGYTNEPLTFDASRSSGPIARYVWDFGDGTTAESASPLINHTYVNRIGVFAVTLTVYDQYGNFASDNTTATIVERTNYKQPETRPQFGLSIRTITIYGLKGELIAPNDEMTIIVDAKNEFSTRLSDSHMTVEIPELGIKQKSESFDLRGNEQKTVMETISLYNVPAGYYYAKITVGNDDVRASRYREFVVRK